MVDFGGQVCNCVSRWGGLASWLAILTSVERGILTIMDELFENGGAVFGVRHGEVIIFELLEDENVERKKMKIVEAKSR